MAIKQGLCYHIHCMIWIVLVITIFLLVSFGYAGRSLAPWLPAHRKDLADINQLIKLSPGEKFCELGSGDGRVSLYIAQHNPDSFVVGIEYFYPLYVWSYVRARLLGIKNIKFVYGNLYAHNLDAYNVVYVFGMIETLNKRLLDKFKNELKPNTRIVSYIFEIMCTEKYTWIIALKTGKKNIFMYKKL